MSRIHRLTCANLVCLQETTLSVYEQTNKTKETIKKLKQQSLKTSDMRIQLNKQLTKLQNVKKIGRIKIDQCCHRHATVCGLLMG